MDKIAKAMRKAENEGKKPGPKDAPGKRSNGPVRTRAVNAPDAVLESHRIMTHVLDPRAPDYYSLLRTQLLQQTRRRGLNTIMVTSVLPGEGKTLTAINLALSIAREVQQTALVVDTVLRKPMVHEYLGLSGDKGLSSYLLHDEPVSDLLVNPGWSKMVVLPGGRPLSGTSEILGSPKMQDLVRELKHRYTDRYVIFDCPHLLNMPDSLVFSASVDGILLVVEAGRTPRKQISDAMDMVGRENILGLVLNKAGQ